MATVVSLTESKIQELMAGWEGVELSQDEINALIGQLWTDVGTHDANLENFQNIVLPALQADLSASSSAVSALNDQIPALESELESNQAQITNLNTVTIPFLQGELASANDWILELNEVTLPELYSQLAANDTLLTELNTVTLPDLVVRVESAEAAVSGIDLTALNAELDAAQSAIDTLNTTTIPGLNTRLTAAEADISAIDLTGLQSDLDAAETAINTLNTTTIPGLNTRLTAAEGDIAAIDLTGLQTDLDAAEAAINTLNTTTLPGLNTRLTAAEGDVTTLEGKFPITGPDISANAITSNKIAADAITAREIAANVITAAEMLANTITANEIATGAITADEIAANAVTAAKILADAVTAGKIAADAITAREIQADAITASEIAADAVTANEIAANAITAIKIAADAVTAAKIQADAVTAGKIAADAITAREIQADSVTASEIAADTITANEVAANAITATEIAANAITAIKINADAVTAGKIAADAITAREIQADAITASEIAANTITAAEIAADTITANQIATDAITANEIAAGAVTATEIAANTITANQIATDAITADEIAADTITANEIATDTITANEIATDTITANEIATGTITALEIAASTITGAKIAADTIAVTKLIVSDLTNLVVDGDLLDPTSATWFEMGGPTGMTRVKDAGQPAYLKNRNKYHSQYVYFRNENMFEIKAGDEFFVSLEVFTPAGNTLNALFNPFLAVFDQDGGTQLWRGMEGGAVTVVPNTNWTLVTGTIKITESGLATAQFNPIADFGSGAVNDTQEFRVRKMQVRRKGTGKLIVDGTIEGKNIKAGSITADEIDTGTLSGDLLAGEVIFGGLIRAGALDEGAIAGGYSEMGAQGIYTVDELGDPVFFAPTVSSDGAYLKAHVDLLSADVKDNFTMHGTNNSIATEAELTLSAGVEAPSVPPTLSQVWDQIQFDKTTVCPPHTPNPDFNMGSFAFSPSQATAMAYDTTWNAWMVIQQKSTGFRVWRFTNTGAIYLNYATGRPWVDDYNNRINASMCFNDDANAGAMVFKSGDDWWFWGPENIARIPASWIIDHSARPPTLTWDTIANNYCLVQSNGGGGGTIHVRRFTVPSSGTSPNAVSVSTNSFEAGSGLSSRLNGAVFGGQLGVSSSWAVSCDDYATVYTFNGGGTMYNDEGTYRNWSKVNASSRAFAHNGTQFASVDSAGVLTFYENWTWLGLDAKVWVGASAADTDAAGTGVHETPVGTMQSITLYRRSKLKMTMPETNDSGAADDADKWRLYFKRGGATAPIDKTQLKMIGDIGSPTVATSIIINSDPIGAAPLTNGIKGQADAYNNFPGADPGRLESAKLMLDGLAQFQVKGDGTGRWGTLTVDAAGKAVIGGDSGWINFALLNGFVPYGAPYATPGYRKIGSTVYLRGLANNGTALAVIANLPVGYRPLNSVIAAGVVENISRDATGDSIPTFSSGAASAGTNHTHNVNAPALDIAVAFTSPAARITISSVDGSVKCDTAGQAAATWVALDGISFLVD